MTDAIFWYTGLGVWAIIAIVFAAAVLLAGVLGAARFYWISAQWVAVNYFTKHDIDRKRLGRLIRRAHSSVKGRMDDKVLAAYLVELHRLAQLPDWDDGI